MSFISNPSDSATKAIGVSKSEMGENKRQSDKRQSRKYDRELIFSALKDHAEEAKARPVPPLLRKKSVFDIDQSSTSRGGSNESSPLKGRITPSHSSPSVSEKGRTPPPTPEGRLTPPLARRVSPENQLPQMERRSSGERHHSPRIKELDLTKIVGINDRNPSNETSFEKRKITRGISEGKVAVINSSANPAIIRNFTPLGSDFEPLKTNGSKNELLESRKGHIPKTISDSAPTVLQNRSTMKDSKSENSPRPKVKTVKSKSLYKKFKKKMKDFSEVSRCQLNQNQINQIAILFFRRCVDAMYLDDNGIVRLPAYKLTQTSLDTAKRIWTELVTCNVLFHSFTEILANMNEGAKSFINKEEKQTVEMEEVIVQLDALGQMTRLDALLKHIEKLKQLKLYKYIFGKVLGENFQGCLDAWNRWNMFKDDVHPKMVEEYCLNNEYLQKLPGKKLSFPPTISIVNLFKNVTLYEIDRCIYNGGQPFTFFFKNSGHELFALNLSGLPKDKVYELFFDALATIGIECVASEHLNFEKFCTLPNPKEVWDKVATFFSKHKTDYRELEKLFSLPFISEEILRMLDIDHQITGETAKSVIISHFVPSFKVLQYLSNKSGGIMEAYLRGKFPKLYNELFLTKLANEGAEKEVYFDKKQAQVTHTRCFLVHEKLHPEDPLSLLVKEDVLAKLWIKLKISDNDVQIIIHKIEFTAKCNTEQKWHVALALIKPATDDTLLVEQFNLLEKSTSYSTLT
jgi:hypothetical protein